MKKPIIIVSPQSRVMEPPYEGEYHYSSTFNTGAILEAGGLPVIPPFLTAEDAEALMETASGLFLTGGADVSPARYGQEPLDACGQTQPDRDRSDLLLLETALRLHKPVLCICRGCQVANVYFGGTLFQDLPTQRPDALSHVARTTEHYRDPVHQVRILEGTPLHTLFGTDALGVNTLHHQAVDALAPCLRPMAYAPDGVLEAWYLPDEDQWLRAYQWHPEMMREAAHRTAVFADFLNACRERDRLQTALFQE